ncbi:MAG: gliding motility-associated C-terminal domain-containing protein, partial [Phaeodactylibacter sp.]|nr:gliding motility-associated C-terminal domain-containing protein [Phaeodactylibacter sp.]
VSITSSGAFALCEGEDFIDLELKIEGAIDSILWSTNETGNSIMVSDTGTYSVTVVNADNCIATDMVLVTDCGDFEIPNIFTPNGDGINDTFGLISAGTVRVLDFKVYNRWGQLVHDQTTPWDGRYNNENHPTDVLAYRIEVETPTGRQVLTGEVTLVR